jgi:hypothetical protein
MSRAACLVCGGLVEQPATGRPRVYCTDTCKRAAANELRRLRRQIEDLERFGSNLRVMGTGERQQQRAAAEVERLTRRMLALMAGQPDDVSAHG